MRSAVWLLLPLVVLQAQAAELYRLDSANTRVSFGVRVLGVSWFSAQFAILSGEFVRDRRAAASHLEVTVRTDSLACDNPWWKARLLSPVWFDAKRYPLISLHADKVRFDDDGGATLEGQLSLHGHTRSVVLIVSRWICTDRSLTGESCSFDAHTRIKRSDYGLPHGFWEGGDEVDIAIRGAAVRAV